MTRGKLGRWMLAACVSAGLIGPNLGCHPASTSASSSTTTKTTTAPEKKNDSVKPPKADPG